MTPTPSFAPVRRATCSVLAGPSRATAWLVSPKGLFATSHSALGYQVEVDLETEPGDRKPARVVWVDVARDLALILADAGLPRAAEPMAPLTLRDLPAVKSGDRVFTVASLPGRGLRIAPASICAAPRPHSLSPGATPIPVSTTAPTPPADLIDLDTPSIGPRGGPVVDTDCRVIGLLVCPPRRAPVPAAAPSRASVLPAADLRTALRALEPAPDLPRRSPVYRCPTCSTPFVPEHDACLACGAPLPHPYPADPSNAPAERTVRDLLATAGVVANRARTGPRTWQIFARPPGTDPVPVTLTLNDPLTAAAFRAPVACAPRTAREPFYRLLLTLNDQTTGPFRLTLKGDRVHLLLAVPIPMLEGRDLLPTLTAFGEAADHFRKILSEGFEAAPLLTLDEAPAW
ncbi:MAG: serine protease [Polyangiaceae bacterium]